MTSPIDFKAVFDRISTPYMMMDHDLVIVERNQAYLDVTGRSREDLCGRYVFDVFPSEGESRRVLEESLLRTRDAGETDVIAVLHYAIPRADASSTEGRLLLDRSLTDEGDRLRFEWREAGGPPARKPDQRGFGSRLIARSITGELRGIIEANYGEEGLVVRFETPLARDFD